MGPTLQPNERQVRDLKSLLDIGATLETAKEKLLASKIVALSPVMLIELIEAELPNWTAPQRNSLVRQGLALRGLMMEAGLSADEVLSGLREGLSEATNFFDGDNAGNAKKWKDVFSPSFKALLESKLFRVTTKSANLAYDYANLLRTARIITDVRPIFDETAEGIDGAVISHVLRLKYTGQDDESSLSIVMDATDIKRLLAECERALTKGQIAQKWLSDGTPIQTHITGDSKAED